MVLCEIQFVFSLVNLKMSCENNFNFTKIHFLTLKTKTMTKKLFKTEEFTKLKVFPKTKKKNR